MTPKEAIKNFNDAAEFLHKQAKHAHEHDDKKDVAENFEKLSKYNTAMAKWWEIIYGDGDEKNDEVSTEDADPGGQPPIPPPPPPPPIG